MNRSDVPARSVRLPLTIRDDEDLAGLVQWFRRLCSNELLRRYFVEGTIDFDIRLAVGRSPEGSHDGRLAEEKERSDTARQGQKQVTDAVVTEAVLRRYGQGGKGAEPVILVLKARAIVTPAARDYAKAAGIRLERSSS
ncbi:MAG TPA: hypothetical protein VFL96_09460 [Acidobacteriaceae bacterium]|nr:hypothetical protein [Acidobacteriaceae bacterium]